VTRPDHERITSLFADACALPPERWDAFLASACPGDANASVRAEVRALLNHDTRATPFLDAPVGGSGAALRLADSALGDADPASGQLRIAGYTVQRLLGVGGMGAVYEARQARPDRLVALKLMRLGAGSRKAIARFEHEATLLGRLRHPGIAAVYEAGVHDGLGGPTPFFAMEYVEGGRPITAYAQEHALSLEQRLRLFLEICDAVHYAHQHAIIHRDLKPANILVDAAGRPKVIDFGVAKAVASDEMLTTLRSDTANVVGTLAYMSPEQASGEAGPPDIRTDVYALGIVLYELLCGRLPYDLSGMLFAAVARTVMDQSPLRPSSIVPSLRGDLETIILKAIAKEREGRYQSVAALADDVRRFLDDLPIEARPPSALYQARLLVRRNRSVAAGVGVALVGLVLGSGAAAWQAVRATRQRDAALLAEQRAQTEAAKAVEEAEAARRIARCLSAVFEAYDSPGAPRTGDQPATRAVLDRSAESIAQELSDRPLDQAALLDQIGRIYISLGMDDRGRRVLESSLRIRERAAGPESPGALDALDLLAKVATRQDQDAAAEDLYRRALQILQRQAAPDAARVAAVQGALANILRRQSILRGEPLLPEAETMIRQAIRNSPQPNRALPGMLALLAQIQSDRGDSRGASESLQWAVRECGTGQESSAAVCLFELARLRRKADDAAGADHALTEALATWQRVPDPVDAQTAYAARAIARTLSLDGRPDLAEAVIRRALPALESLLGSDNLTSIDMRLLLAIALHDQGRHPEAIAEYRAVLAGYRKGAGEENPALGTCLLALARIAAAAGDREALLDLDREARALEKVAAALPDDHPHRTGVLLLRGTIDLGLGDAPSAERHLRECVALRSRSIGERHRMTHYTQSVLAGALTAQGRFEEAWSLLQTAVPAVESSFGPTNSMVVEVRQRLLSLERVWRESSPATAPEDVKR
jgi:tetratricopeptide (TPR) repeat protein